MGLIGDSVDSVKIRRLLTQCVSFGMVVTCALIFRMALTCFSGSVSHAGAIHTGSMEPGIKRGDALFLSMSKNPIRAGEIVVFRVHDSEFPFVHRVIQVHERRDSGEVDVLTKGDNNNGDDRKKYTQGQQWLHRHDIIGRVVGFAPNAGWFSVITYEHPITWWIIVGAVGLLTINLE